MTTIDLPLRLLVSDKGARVIDSEDPDRLRELVQEAISWENARVIEIREITIPVTLCSSPEPARAEPKSLLNVAQDVHAMIDEHNLTGRRVRANLILRGSKSTEGKQKLIAFGFILDLDVEALMAASGGKDIHLIAEVTIDRAGSVTADHTWNQGPEDILEQGIPAFTSHGNG